MSGAAIIDLSHPSFLRAEIVLASLGKSSYPFARTIPHVPSLSLPNPVVTTELVSKGHVPKLFLDQRRLGVPRLVFNFFNVTPAC